MNAEERWPFTMHDLVVRNDLCNLRCDYCGLATENVPPMVRRGGVVGLRSGSGIANAEAVSTVAERILTHIFATREHCDFALLKISGGELTVVPEWVELLFRLAAELPALQLLTNGTALDRRQIERLAQLRNVSVQVSLDGPTAAANAHRHLTTTQVERSMNMIRFFVESGVPVEINVVLSRTNVEEFASFAQWAAEVAGDRRGRLMLLPRPVRGSEAITRTPSANAMQMRASLADAPSSVLPSAEYLDRMFGVLDRGTRSHACYVPYYVLGTQDRGQIDVCTCGPHLGAAEGGAAYLRTGSTFDPASSESACTGCITQYEMFNLLYEDRLGDDELAAIPSLRLPGVLEGAHRTTAALRRRFATA